MNDARFVVLNARDAANRGADVRVRTRVISAEDENGTWKVRIQNLLTGEIETVRARYLVNAAGPWVDHVISGVLGQNDVHNVRLVKGQSHRRPAQIR